MLGYGTFEGVKRACFHPHLGSELNRSAGTEVTGGDRAGVTVEGIEGVNTYCVHLG